MMMELTKSNITLDDLYLLVMKHTTSLKLYFINFLKK